MFSKIFSTLVKKNYLMYRTKGVLMSAIMPPSKKIPPYIVDKLSKAKFD